MLAGVTALYARETHGAVSERAGTSLAACATLVQCTMQGEEPDARGPWARGRSPLNRVYQVGFPEVRARDTERQRQAAETLSETETELNAIVCVTYSAKGFALRPVNQV